MPKVYLELNKIKAAYENCQHKADAPHRFRASLPDGECVFNKEVSLDLMYLNGLAVLYVVDRVTKFGVAFYLAK